MIDEKLINQLFIMAYKQAKKKRDLWWQVRTLQELGWKSELNNLILKNKSKIKRSNNVSLKQLLFAIEGKKENYIKSIKEEAKNTHILGISGNVIITDKKK